MTIATKARPKKRKLTVAGHYPNNMGKLMTECEPTYTIGQLGRDLGTDRAHVSRLRDGQKLPLVTTSLEIVRLIGKRLKRDVTVEEVWGCIRYEDARRV